MKRLYIQFLLFFPVFWLAQIPKIEIFNGKGTYKTSDQVSLQKLQIETKIVGKISTNTITMVLKNNSGRLREGRVTFPLPEGVSVSGYALDINGKLRNAVPVEKEKAKEVYETIKKRNIDPGLLEKVEGNNFRTTVYPIAPNGGERTLQITYHYELKKSGNSYQYFLPLDHPQQIPDFTIKTSVYQNAERPQLAERQDGTFDFIKNGNIWSAEMHKTHYKPGSNLKINFPMREGSQNILMQQASAGSSYFFADLNMIPNERDKRLPNRIAVVWDNSLSGKNRDHLKEFTLLEEYFKVNKNVTVKTYFISNTFETGKTFKVNDGNWSELKTFLSKTSYDGGTDYSRLKSLDEDEIFFFTDGISSFGEMKLAWNKPTYTISSSNTADFSQLKYISNKTNGEFLNLNENDPRKEVRKLLFQPLRFLGIESNASVSEVYPSISEPISQDFVLTGILKENKTTLKAKFGYGNEVTETKLIVLDTTNQMVKDWEVSTFWAQKKLDELEIFQKQNKDEIKNLTRQFGLVSSNMSLMVLENVEDYVRYEITPPSELRTQFDEIVKNNRIAKDAKLNDLMARAELMTVNLKEWWKKEYKPKPKQYPKPAPVSTRRDTARVSDIEEVIVTGFGEERTSVIAERRREQQQMSLKEMSYVASNTPQALQGRVAGLQVGYRNEFSNRSAVINPGKIKTIEVESKAGYMKLFNGEKNPEILYKIYLQNRPEYEKLPQYYFDVAQVLFKNNDRTLGIKVLSAIADLDLENEEFYKLLAYKLKQAKVYDKELFATQKVLEWRPFDPQSYRDVALAFEDNGNYQAALENLYKVLTQSYTKELADRDNGIEEIIIMEINELVANHGKELDLKNINPKILADLPVNIRVVINWSKDDTDIDLWVTDPNNERCYYSNKETEIGGRLSDDFTRGFGPEQFLLKKALKGKYKIQTNFFGERQVGIAGPTAIMAEIYINYATGKQERKTVVFQNQKENGKNDDGILIGEFEF